MRLVLSCCPQEFHLAKDARILLQHANASRQVCLMGGTEVATVVPNETRKLVVFVCRLFMNNVYVLYSGALQHLRQPWRRSKISWTDIAPQLTFYEKDLAMRELFLMWSSVSVSRGYCCMQDHHDKSFAIICSFPHGADEVQRSGGSAWQVFGNGNKTRSTPFGYFTMLPPLTCTHSSISDTRKSAQSLSYNTPLFQDSAKRSFFEKNQLKSRLLWLVACVQYRSTSYGVEKFECDSDDCECGRWSSAFS